MNSSFIKSMVFATCLALAGWGAQAQTQELKIGYVNSDKVLRDALPARAAYTKIEAEFGRRDKDLTELAGRIKSAADKLDKEVPALGESERVRRQRELVDQDRELQRKRREYQEDLNQRRNEELAALVDRANKIIKRIAEEKKYDLIVQEVIYVSSRIDITDDVIKELNKPGGK